MCVSIKLIRIKITSLGREHFSNKTCRKKVGEKMCSEYILDDCIGTFALVFSCTMYFITTGGIRKKSLLNTHRFINVSFSNYHTLRIGLEL